ncbi:GNAT family N-acetyltransferase [soil metagenome]
MHTTAPALEFFEDPAVFLTASDAFLAADPVLVTVVSTVTRRCLAGEVATGSEPRWWVTVRDAGGDVVAVGMRTAPGGASPPYLTAMSEDAARALARALVERGEVITQVNGALPACLVVAEETARLTGGEPRIIEHTRLHLLGTLRAPAPVTGRLRSATPEDLDVCLAWWEAFEVDAAAQSGRAPGHGPLEPQDAETMLARIDGGRIALWEDDRGQVVHLTAANLPAYGVVRVGPVYTPGEQRGRGYASATVAAVAGAAQRAGHQVCLFTDQENPVSNRIYAALGFEPVVDMAHVEIG